MATEADMWNFGENFAVHIQYPTTIAEPVTISDFHLFQNYPNPFNPSTRISYFLEEQSKVSLRVYDMLGEEILTLVDAVQYAGVHEVHWTGTTQLGVPAASGTYLCALKAESNSGREFSAVRKVLFLR
jgi:flagellar hook assembly protein FlgD